jgi:hypothetical protein
MKKRDLKLQRASPNEWLLADAITGHVVGGITYMHAADGNHYQAWLNADGARNGAGEPLAQLAMAARALEDALSK